MIRRSLLLATLVALGLVLRAPGIAQAHALLVTAQPQPGTVVPREPARIHLWFSEDLNPALSRVIVKNARQHAVDRRDDTVADGRELSVSLRPDLPDGTYLVLWTSVSTDDGHVVQGAYDFSIGHRGPAASATLPAGGGFPDLTELIGLLARWLELNASVLWLGLALFVTVILPWTSAGHGTPAAPASEVSRRACRTLPMTLAALIVAKTLELVAQANATAGGGWPATFTGARWAALVGQSTYGHLWLTQVGVAAAALGLTLILAGRRVLSGDGQSGMDRDNDIRLLSVVIPAPRAMTATAVLQEPLMVLGALNAYLVAASGHANSVDFARTGAGLFTLPVFIDWIHVLAAGIWIGGILTIALVILPAVSSLEGGQRGPALIGALDRFSPFAYGSVAALALTGVFNTTVHIPSWYALFHSTYGQALIAKVTCIACLLAISAITVYIDRPRHQRAVTFRAPSTTVLHLQRLLMRRLRWSALLGVGVLLATSIMNSYPVPPAIAAPAWQSVGLPGVVVHQVALWHRDDGLAFAAAFDGVYRWRNGTWQRVLHDGDVWSIALLPDDHTVIAGDDAGYVDISTDRGLHWRRTLVASRGIFAISAQPGNPRVILAGAAYGLYRSLDGGLHWQRVLALRNSAVDALAWQPGDRSVVLVGAVSGGRGGSSAVYASRNGGMTWHVLGHGLRSEAGVMSLAMTRSRHVVAGTMGNATWTEAITKGAWRKSAGGMPPVDDHVSGLAVLPGGSTMFAGTLGYGVFRSEDGGTHWQSVSRGLPASRGANVVLSVTYSPAQHALYAATGNGVYAMAVTNGK